MNVSVSVSASKQEVLLLEKTPQWLRHGATGAGYMNSGARAKNKTHKSNSLAAMLSKQSMSLPLPNTYITALATRTGGDTRNNRSEQRQRRKGPRSRWTAPPQAGNSGATYRSAAPFLSSDTTWGQARGAGAQRWARTAGRPPAPASASCDHRRPPRCHRAS